VVERNASLWKWGLRVRLACRFRYVRTEFWIDLVVGTVIESTTICSVECLWSFSMCLQRIKAEVPHMMWTGPTMLLIRLLPRLIMNYAGGIHEGSIPHFLNSMCEALSGPLSSHTGNCVHNVSYAFAANLDTQICSRKN
jgi:hypothetical protein